MSAALSDPFLLLPATFLLGLMVGSFLNVLIFRLPKRLEEELALACQERRSETEEVQTTSPYRWFGLGYLISPPSTCPHCGHRIRAWENIPLLSWLRQKGRCMACGGTISIQYPIVEFLTGLLSMAVAWHFGFGWQTAAALVLTWALIALSVIDIRTQLLPDLLTLPMIWLGLLVNLHGLFTDIESAIYGAVFGYLSLWFIFHLFLLITRKEGMGYGDFKLFALLGAWLGWQFLPQILLLSAAVGALTGIALILLQGRDKSQPIPFGPYLAAAGWIALLWGETINRNYLQLTGF